MKLLICHIVIILLFSGCGPKDTMSDEQRRWAEFNKLSQEEKDYIERFNILIKDIQEFPPPGKDLEKYFHVFKSVTNLQDAEIFLFTETHTQPASQIWTAGAINKLIKPNDAVLFEGALANTPAGNVAELITTDIFAVREYEKYKSHKKYKATSRSKIRKKYQDLFIKTKTYLALDTLRLNQAQGFFWDLPRQSTEKRNAAMVITIKDQLKGNRVFVIAGALHIPHYEYAYKMYEMKDDKDLLNKLVKYQAKIKEINQGFYDMTKGSTEIIFKYLKNQKFAVLIPRNLPQARDIAPFFPTSLAP